MYISKMCFECKYCTMEWGRDSWNCEPTGRWCTQYRADACEYFEDKEAVCGECRYWKGYGCRITKKTRDYIEPACRYFDSEN